MKKPVLKYVLYGIIVLTAIETFISAFLVTGILKDRKKNEETLSEKMVEAVVPSVMPTPLPTATPLPTPSPTPFMLKTGSAGEEVSGVIARLIELGYMPDSYSDVNIFTQEVADAVDSFQESNGLEITGIVDKNCLDILLSDSAVVYDDFEDLAPTIHMSFEELTGDNGNYDLPKGYPKSGTYRIIVDIYHQVTIVYTKDENGEYKKPVRYMLCSTGKGDATPVGTFKVGKYRVRFAQFKRDKTYGQYWTYLFKAFYFHTTLYEKKDASSYIKKTTDALGTEDSHGCIRLTVPDARWMFYNIAPDTECEIRRGSKDDLETASIRERLILAKAPEERVKLVAGEIPDTDNWKIEDIKIEEPFVQGRQEG